MSETTATGAPGEPARACSRCKTVKPAVAFHRAGPGKRKSVCAACRPSTRTRSQDTRNICEPQELKRSRLLWGEYRITLGQYDQMRKAQGGKCLLCNEPPPEGTNLYVDHCHKSGVVRALLCCRCNLRLGTYEALQERAAWYLANYGDGNPLLKPTVD